MDTYEHDELAELMAEAPHGANYGRCAKDGLLPEDSAYSHRRPVAGSPQTLEQDLLWEGGWHVERGSAHRGVLVGDEHIDKAALLAAVEDELGFTIDEIHSVYRQGRMTDPQRELRGRIDARLLALSRSEANMLALARIFGWDIDSGGKGDNCRTMERALARARVQEDAKRRDPTCDRCGRETPAVITPCRACPA